MKNILLLILFLVLVTVRLLLAPYQDRELPYPNHPVRIVVPYLAGGGTDTFARTLQKTINDNDLLGVPVVIENRDGGSATLGSRFVKNSKPDGYRILCHHEGIIATRLAGVVPYGPEAFQPIAQTGSIVLLMVVRADSPHQTLPKLLEAARDQPNSIRMGANPGSPAYFICKQLLAEYPGADFNFVSASGVKRITYILGGKLEAGIFSLSEYLNFREADDTPPAENIVAIVNFGKKRNPTIPEVATSLEQGLQTSASNAYYFWAPRETPGKVVTTLADALQEAMTNPATLQALEERALDPTFRTGEALEKHLATRVAEFERLAIEAQTDLPDFVFWIGLLTLATLVGVIVASNRSPASSTGAFLPISPDKPPERFVATGSLKQKTISAIILLIYLGSLQWSAPFWMATTLVIAALAFSVSPPLPQHKKWKDRVLAYITTGLGVSLVVEVLFTRLFSVPLP
ncbi:MAG: tripartite tricarboxylate transporter substrate-binding protein [Planctomycetota bacterium]|nr:tripartite tricarboxylate transporter substrate-binding protein [Planctomycetota bacterium]